MLPAPALCQQGGLLKHLAACLAEPIIRQGRTANFVVVRCIRMLPAFGYPKTSLEQMMKVILQWYNEGGKTIDKPTHYKRTKRQVLIMATYKSLDAAVNNVLQEGGNTGASIGINERSET